MNLTELKQWMKESELVSTINIEYDDCGNEDATKIFKNNDKFYRVEFCNDQPYHNFDKSTICNPVFIPVEVKKHQVEVIETYWLTDEEAED